MSDPSRPPTPDPDKPDLRKRARDLIGTHHLWSGQLLYTCVRLGVVDYLDADDPVRATEIAEEFDLHPENTYRVLRALSHFDVLHEDEEKRFSLTELGECFTPDHPQSVRNVLLLDRSPAWMRAMFHVGDVLREGGPTGFEREHGVSFFEYTEQNVEFGEAFNGHMSDLSRNLARALLDALAGYDFSGVSSVCDVGGGHGYLLCSFLANHPGVEGTVLDLPGVVADTENQWASEFGVADRCAYEAGDMFEAVPTADAYFMKYVLHDWADDDCRRILSTVHDAAPDDARLFVVELVVPGPDTPHFSKRLDMAMMTHLGGRERTREEYESLLDDAGWTLEAVWEPDDAELSVLEACKA